VIRRTPLSGQRGNKGDGEADLKRRPKAHDKLATHYNADMPFFAPVGLVMLSKSSFMALACSWLMMVVMDRCIYL